MAEKVSLCARYSAGERVIMESETIGRRACTVARVVTRVAFYLSARVGTHAWVVYEVTLDEPSPCGRTAWLVCEQRLKPEVVS